MDDDYQVVNECLLFDNITTGQYSCKKIPLPDSVTGRYDHSITAVTMSPNCVWLVIVGGSEGLTEENFLITDTNRLIMIVELVHEAGEWIVQSVLDANDLTSKKYQEKYLSYSKTRTWRMDQIQLTEYPTEKEMKLQRYIQFLHQELQVAHQNKVSLQEALTEANKQGSKVDSNKLVILNQKLEEVSQEKQILTEDNEKLRATVAYNEVYITELEEEKKQVEEEKRKVEDENKQAKKEKEEAEEEKRQLEEQYLIDKQTTRELKTKFAVNGVYITELEEENEKVEKQYRKEKQINKDLKSKVSDNERYTAKLMKEKEQLQEKVTSLEEQSINKTTSTKEVQFDYLIPSMDNLECLSDVQVAEKKLFLIQGDKAQLMNWEKYGLRIGVQEGSLLSSETVEAVVVALVGGQFEFPPNTVLVSAVYAVSLSKPLLKQLKLEIQHCVDLTGRPDLAQYLKFAIAPVDTPSLPYQFSIVEEGEFSSNGGYGSIHCNKFSFACILGKEWINEGGDGVPITSVNGDTEEGEEEEEEQQPQQEEEEEEDEEQQLQHEKEGIDQWQQDHENIQQRQEEEMEEGDEDKEGDGSSSDSSSVFKETNSTLGTGGAAKESNNERKRMRRNKGVEQIDEHSSSTGSIASSPLTMTHSTGIKDTMIYAGLIYYEEDSLGDLVTFTAARKLNALLEFIEKKHPQAKQRPHFYFRIASPNNYIELNLNAPQDEPFTGWSIKPHMKPCKLYQRDIYNFGNKEYSLPPSCLISIYSSPDAVPKLHYSVPIDGVADPVTLYIQISQRTTHHTAAAPGSSGSNEAKSVLTKRRIGDIDIKTAKQKIKQVIIENHTTFAELLQFSLDQLANKLFEAKIITRQVQKSPT